MLQNWWITSIIMIKLCLLVLLWIFGKTRKPRDFVEDLNSVTTQGELNPGLWLATQAGKMELSCLLGTTCRVLQEKFPPKPLIINPLLTKLVRSRWLDIGLTIFCVFLDLDSVSVHKQAGTWPHTWSITHMWVSEWRWSSNAPFIGFLGYRTSSNSVGDSTFGLCLPL